LTTTREEEKVAGRVLHRAGGKVGREEGVEVEEELGNIITLFFSNLALFVLVN
jgi:hypothetical protein